MLIWNHLKFQRLRKLIPNNWSSFFKQYSTKDRIKIYENSLKVHPGFGKLFLKSHCNCTILPTDHQLYPDLDHIKIINWSAQGNTKPNVKVELHGKTNNVLKLEILPNPDESELEIFIPMKYDIEADLEGTANLRIQNVESDQINITSSHGSITTKNIKTEEMSLSAEESFITLDGTFQGNLIINAMKLTVKAKRLQGTLLCVQADILQTEIESSYMTKGIIFANEGNLHIKNLHGSTEMYLSKGELSINGLHGKLQSVVDEGNVDVYVSEVTDFSLIQLGKGFLQLSFSKLSDKNIAVSAPLLEMSPDIEALGSKLETKGRCRFSITNQSAPVLHANVSEGKLKMLIKDWFTSLGIKS